MRVEEFDNATIPYCSQYVLHITNDYTTTQYYRTAEKLKSKLQEYSQYKIDKVEEKKKKKTFEMFISGKLPTKYKSRIVKIRY